MKRKILILALSLALVICAVGGVVSFASDGEESRFTGGYRTEYYEENYTITDDYKDSKTIVFDKTNTSVAGYDYLIRSNSGTSALKKARSLMSKQTTKDDIVTILLQSDTAIPARYDNEGQIIGNVVVDLNGYTVDLSASAMVNAVAKISDSSVLGMSVTYKNGTILVGDSGLIANGIYGTTYNSTADNYKNMSYYFENVDIRFIEGTSCKSLVGTYFEDSTVGRVAQDAYKTAKANGTLATDCPTAHMQYMGLNVSFDENCTIDVSNVPAGFTLFNACDPVTEDTMKTCTGTVNDVSGVSCYYFATNCIVNMKVCGSKIICGANNFVWTEINTENGSSVTFEKGADGEYSQILVPKESAVDTSFVFDGEEEKTALLNMGESGGYYTYNMMSKSFCDKINNNGFVPKTSVTLDSELILNLYVPEAEELISFEADGVVYDSEEKLSSLETRVANGVKYYRIKKSIDAAEADETITLSAKLSIDGNVLGRKYSVSIPKYAAALRASTSATDNEKILAGDILSYVLASMDYFGTDGKEEVEKLIDTDYNTLSTVLKDSTEEKTSVFKSAALYLGAKPAVRFYIGDSEIESYAFYIDGKEIDVIYNEEEKYIETDVYAYQLAEEITYVVNGEEGNYHIGNYYDFASGSGENDYSGEDKEKLAHLTERFWKYLQSARAYRSDVIGESKYAHEHSFITKEYEMTAENPHYVKTACACGYMNIDQKTGLDFGDKKISVYFLGNSYTNYNNMSDMFGMIATSMGIDVEVTKTTKGGWHLWKYANKNDTGGEMFYAAIEANDFDYAFIQDGSTQTLAAIAEFYDGVRLVGEVLENDGATPILYQTWGRKEGHAVLDTYNHTPESMARYVAAAYEAISEETGYTNSPVGSAFFDVYTNHPEIDIYHEDLTHPSPTGSYLVALCHYATLFGRSPIGVKYTNGLDAETALILQTAAHNAVYGESIVTEEYKTSSEGIHVAKAENNLYELPEGSELISAGITGDNGLAASTVTVAKDSTLTDEQRADLANIAYGVSVIGGKNMVTSLARAADGVWGSGRVSFDFDENYYDITGRVDMHEPYRALITYNFGGIVNITAIGYMSGNMDGFAQAQDVYISNDGISWSVVSTASYDAVLLEKDNGSLHSLNTLPTDANGNTSGVCAVFDMNSANGGVYAKYVRFAIKEGVVVSNKQYDINTLELAVWGNAENSYLADLPEGVELISKGLTASEEFSTTELTAEQKADIANMAKYGMTLIGAKTLERSIKYACDGVWSGTNRLSAVFYDGEETPTRYDINGNEAADGKYECLITYNFGEKVTLNAIGYMSGDLNGFAQNQEVWVSDDGINWIKVTTACFNRAGGDTIASVANKPIDKDGTGKASGQCVMFDMGGVKAQYVRVAIIDGMSDTKYDKDLNTYELAVYGKKD